MAKIESQILCDLCGISSRNVPVQSDISVTNINGVRVYGDVCGSCAAKTLEFVETLKQKVEVK